MQIISRIYADGKFGAIEETFLFSGNVASRLESHLSTVSEGEGKLKAKVEWNGVKVNYKFQTQAKLFGFSAGAKRAQGEIPVFGPEIIYEITLWFRSYYFSFNLQGKCHGRRDCPEQHCDPNGSFHHLGRSRYPCGRRAPF
ncbi:hypothetical protein JMK10_21075 [Rhodovulum sulfidophilum]|uniref:hypothetical protein n=1 Tax=Rhodovulum sulfidophilum TaxID=35806 RepID=UPI001920A8C7|nr:hypothetical protein [Rhodovulum sulfidophilum]MBL3576410.1 hypothetical protein [Rhodovulum sulfidophilum]MCE8433890.1 hypothetical protein [Rhodovulum sulfidophilum]MCF4119161.1 hypothetical protein [Rhodovulum sulfidophilum]